MNESQSSAVQAIAEQAADWYLELEGGELDGASRKEFVQWLRESPTHIEEFLRVRSTHALVAGMENNDLHNIESLLLKARSNVVSLPGNPQNREKRQTDARNSRISAIVASIAAIVAILSVFSDFFYSLVPTGLVDQHVYETTLGEQRSVLLSDGSIVELNTDSELRVSFTDKSRLVELIVGEAVFDVAKDPQRPFRVNAGTTIVEAVGTRFNVYRQDTQTIVTVIEGRVAVARSDDFKSVATVDIAGSATAHELSPGGQIVITSDGATIEPVTVDATKAIAWTLRRLVFDNDSLATVARELNRYNEQQLTIADPAIAARRISGIFDANDPDTLIAFLETMSDVHIDRESGNGGWTVRAELTEPSTQHN